MADNQSLNLSGDEVQLPEEKRDRSSIQFPYLGLDEAIAIAKGVHEVGGSSCQVDQLAGHLKQSPASSMFRLRVSTARIFGLVTNAQGTVTLTPLGNRICDSHQEQAAKADSFLAVPLYRAVYDQFKNLSLPPNNGLETAMVNMGVAPKQKNNARQVFQRSATQAGFFAFGNGRLVYPPMKGNGSAVTANTEPPAKPEVGDDCGPAKNGGNDGEGFQHPFIQGLIKTLPPTDGPWPIEKRAKWLHAAANIFELIYEDQAAGTIQIKIQKDPN